MILAWRLCSSVSHPRYMHTIFQINPRFSLWSSVSHPRYIYPIFQWNPRLCLWSSASHPRYMYTLFFREILDYACGARYLTQDLCTLFFIKPSITLKELYISPKINVQCFSDKSSRVLIELYISPMIWCTLFLRSKLRLCLWSSISHSIYMCNTFQINICLWSSTSHPPYMYTILQIKRKYNNPMSSAVYSLGM